MRRPASPLHDGPLILNPLASHAEEPVVKVHGRIAVRDDEAQSVAQLNGVVATQDKPAMFIACEFIRRAADTNRLGPERAIRGERF